MGSYRTVVVGTDGSRSSLRAVDRAAAVAQATGATLVAVCAYRPLPEHERRRAADELGDDAYKVMGAHPAEDALREAAGHARTAGVTSLELIAEEGEPVDVLCAVAERVGADLVVVGNRGLNSLAGRLLGSVPAGVSHRAGCDILIAHTTGGR